MDPVSGSVEKAWGFVSTPTEAFLFLAFILSVMAVIGVWRFFAGLLQGRDDLNARYVEAIARRDELIQSLQDKRVGDVRDLHQSTLTSLAGAKEAIAAQTQAVDRMRESLERAPLPRGRG